MKWKEVKSNMQENCLILHKPFTGGSIEIVQISIFFYCMKHVDTKIMTTTWTGLFYNQNDT